MIDEEAQPMTFPDISQPPGPAEVASWLQQDAVLFRDACARIANRWDYVRSLGEGHVGADTWRLYNLLGTLPLAYSGRASQPDEYNFDEALAPARRGL
jgi:hypothetical protein